MLNATPIKPLVNTPDAVNFFQSMSIKTGRKVAFGDPSKLPNRASIFINRADEAIEYGIKKVSALHNDETRTEVSRHGFAKRVAEDVVKALNESKAGLDKLASELHAEGVKLIDEGFALNEKRHPIHADIRGFIRDLAKKENGIVEIRKLVERDFEVATVFHDTPHYLLGLAEGTHESIDGDSIKRHLPNAAACIIQSAEVEKAAARYPKVINGVQSSFYNPAMADKAAQRVEA
ncbi:MAG: hypothetical protein HLUCCA04_05340 [Oceanicaulis sp. HLUCCA04]|nr:MAG: hypothetical protein HLUCCA04_05340 [Oceanicaulis sp. HLUCCA04]